MIRSTRCLHTSAARWVQESQPKHSEADQMASREACGFHPSRDSEHSAARDPDFKSHETPFACVGFHRCFPQSSFLVAPRWMCNLHLARVRQRCHLPASGHSRGRSLGSKVASRFGPDSRLQNRCSSNSKRVLHWESLTTLPQILHKLPSATTKVLVHNAASRMITVPRFRLAVRVIGLRNVCVPSIFRPPQTQERNSEEEEEEEEEQKKKRKKGKRERAGGEGDRGRIASAALAAVRKAHSNFQNRHVPAACTENKTMVSRPATRSLILKACHKRAPL